MFLACPLLGLLAVWLAERLIRLYRTWQAVSTNLNRRGQLAALLERRADLVAMVQAARTPAPRLMPRPERRCATLSPAGGTEGVA